MERKGLWICIEGVDATGKKAQVKQLHSRLLDLDEDNHILTVHEPTWRAKKIKEKLRKDKSSYEDGLFMAALYTDDRQWNEINFIHPILNAGGIVISNRHKYSTDAYQSAQGVDLDTLIELQKSKGISTPDIAVFLEISPETAAERMRKHGEYNDKFERDLEFQMKVAEQYRILASRVSSDKNYFGNIARINANPNESQVAENVWSKVHPFYEKWKKQNS